MDGTASLAESTMTSGISGVIVTLRVVRDSAARASDLVITGADVGSADTVGLEDLVGRSFREMLPSAAEELLDRLEASNGETVELRESDDAAERRHLLTARPARDGDVWTVTVDALPVDLS
jgi:hypothetical protein